MFVCYFYIFKFIFKEIVQFIYNNKLFNIVLILCLVSSSRRFTIRGRNFACFDSFQPECYKNSRPDCLPHRMNEKNANSTEVVFTFDHCPPVRLTRHRRFDSHRYR